MTENKQGTADTGGTNLTQGVPKTFTPVEVEFDVLRVAASAMMRLNDDQDAIDRVLEYLNNRFGV